MAEHAAFVPLSSPPRGTSPASVRMPACGTHQLGFASRTTSFSDDNELASQHDWVHDVLVRITRHPQFEVLFPCINQCLQLDDRSWKTYWAFREDPDVRSKLEALHSSIWHAPPEEIWVNIVQLRHRTIFPKLRPLILTEVQKAYCHSHKSVSNPLQHMPGDGSGWNMCAGVMIDHPPVFPPTSSASRTVSDNNTPNMLPNGRPHSYESVPPSDSRQTNGHTNTQRPYARLAPEGMAFQCPSLNCPRGFKKRAHYSRHLSRQHPDFGLRHPHHYPEMALRPRASSNTSNERPSQRREMPSSAFDDAIDDSARDSLMLDDAEVNTEVMYMGGDLMLGSLNIGHYYNGMPDN